ncbi:hypothetical protein GCM10011325_37140 [Dyadobacter sediminis]|nr:hypothetical protein GCM10011325_37140 [Dyadobacter sediminis]
MLTAMRLDQKLEVGNTAESGITKLPCSNLGIDWQPIEFISDVVFDTLFLLYKYYVGYGI